ncbi:MAG TPA: hypothetical protein VEI03_08035 [Stellaceae bacterium]|nr:hypothetical protein [Stellaceae bacterium]
MIPISPLARMTMFYHPLARPLLAELLEASKREALGAYAEDYARRSGYRLSQQGEWTTDVTP